jgi:hypothetical protein
VSALYLGTYRLRSQVLRGYVRGPRPASPGSTTKVEACHPLLSCPVIPAATGHGLHHLGRYRVNAIRPTPIPGHESAPVGAGGGRDAPTGADRQGRGRSKARASPEMRPGSHHDDWAATPQAAPSH